MNIHTTLASAILLLLAVAAPFAVAQDAPLQPTINLIVVDDPRCPPCQNFNAELGQEGYDQSPLAARAVMSFVTSGSPHNPKGFGQAYTDGRIKPIKHTPTFIFTILNEDGQTREVGRFVGYKDPAHFFGKVEEMLGLIEPHMKGQLYVESGGDLRYHDLSPDAVKEFDERNEKRLNKLLREQAI